MALVVRPVIMRTTLDSVADIVRVLGGVVTDLNRADRPPHIGAAVRPLL